MSFQPVKTAILGVGLSGLTFHAPFVLALPQYFKLTAVLERKPTSPGGKLAARFGEEAAKGVKIYNTLDQVLADSEIELVIVGTPSETHYEYTKRSLLAGKHGTFCFDDSISKIDIFAQSCAINLSLRLSRKRLSLTNLPNQRNSFFTRTRTADGTRISSLCANF